MNKFEATEHIGETFRKYRLKNKLTQGEVAEMADLEIKHISQIERGLTKGSVDTLIKLCNAYKITPDLVLYDVLDDETKNSISIYEENFKKLSLEDKNTILYLIDYFLNKK
jgi:transcriptional regulator with XRE-family HTH domain